MKPIILSLVLFISCWIELLPQKVGDAYALNINNIYMPLNSKGILAAVNVPPYGSGGQFDGHTFLFSGGFFLSGYSNGTLWANAVASASLVEDYLPGTVANPNTQNAVLYKLSSNEEPFGQSWQDWADAVNLGADFYDGNNDGIYNPVDYNLNGQWDLSEDRPDLLGDVTLWCVFHDGVPSSQRRWNTVEPQGIEIRQTVFAYSSQEEIGNIMFIRYRIRYVGVGNPSEPDTLDDVYFGVWSDPDIGNSQDDLVGCDTLRKSGLAYNNGPDNVYGSNPPAFFSSTLAGPRAYIPGVTYIDINGNGNYDDGIDISIDTAYVIRGQILGITEYPGARNQFLSSSVEYMNGQPNLQDPNNKNEARSYMLGLNGIGQLPDPCSWVYGEVRGGVDCSLVDPMFWYSGDPIQNVGWINSFEADKRQMQNVGPFKLVKGEEQEMFIAYVIGQSDNALASIDEARRVWGGTYILYVTNFNPIFLSVDDKATDIFPKETILSQNYPNPFNPSTKISWQSPNVSHQTLKIYDVLGNEVATLVDEYKPAGSYKVEWDASGFPSGIYFYQLVTESFVETKKMILMK